MAKIDVYRSLLPGDRVIGWDMKMMSHPNLNASFVNIWDRLIWRRSPNLTRTSKLAAAPNCALFILLVYIFTCAYTHVHMPKSSNQMNFKAGIDNSFNQMRLGLAQPMDIRAMVIYACICSQVHTHTGLPRGIKRSYLHFGKNKAFKRSYFQDFSGWGIKKVLFWNSTLLE